MRKINLELYESPTPPEDIRLLWADVDEDTGDLKAIHRYNPGKGEWEPFMVSVDYLSKDEDNTPDDSEDSNNNP